MTVASGPPRRDIAADTSLHYALAILKVRDVTFNMDGRC